MSDLRKRLATLSSRGGEADRFRAPGHSPRAIGVLTRLRRIFQVQLSLAMLFAARAGEGTARSMLEASP